MILLGETIARDPTIERNSGYGEKNTFSRMFRESISDHSWARELLEQYFSENLLWRQAVHSHSFKCFGDSAKNGDIKNF